MVQVSKKATMTGHLDCVYALSHSPRTGSFFSAAGDGMVVAWDIDNPDEGQLIARVPNSIYAMDMHESSGLLCVGHNYDGVHFINWQEKQEEGSLKCTEGAIFSLFSYGEYLFVGDSAGNIHQIDVVKRRLLKTVRHSDKSVRSIDINPETGHLAAGYSDNQVRILDLANLEVIKVLSYHTNSVFTVRFHQGNGLLISAGRDARIISYDVSADYQKVHDIPAHMYAINNIEFSPDGKHFVTCSMDKSIKIWDVSTFNLLKVIDKARLAGHGTSVNRLLWMNDENVLISASDDRTISAWEIEF